MKTLILTISLVLTLANSGFAKDLKLFNPSVFGKHPDSTIRLFFKNLEGNVLPMSAQIDCRDGVYHAATARYSSEDISLNEALTSLNRLYANYQNPKNSAESASYFTWRAKDQDLVIQLMQEDDLIVVRYISLKYAGGLEESKNYQRDEMDEFYNFER